MAAPSKKAIRWTREQACREFGINVRTLADRLTQNNIQPGPDDAFTTMQICAAVFGDMDSEKLRLVKEQANKVALDNAERRGEMVDRRKLEEFLGRALSDIRQNILTAANLEQEDKHKILLGVKKCWDSVTQAVSESEPDAGTPTDLHSEPVGGTVPVSVEGV